MKENGKKSILINLFWSFLNLLETVKIIIYENPPSKGKMNLRRRVFIRKIFHSLLFRIYNLYLNIVYRTGFIVKNGIFQE